jgi:hypothetical protein
VDEQIVEVTFSVILPPPSRRQCVASGIRVVMRLQASACFSSSPDERQKVGLMIMQRTAYTALACGAIAALAATSLALGRNPGSDIVGGVQSITNTTGDLISRGYEAAPALMLGLAILAVVPLVALVAPLIEALVRPPEVTRRFRPTAALDQIAKEISGEIAAHPPHAFLEVVGNEATRFPMARDMLRIGREEDNDIRIPSNAVHRYHAAIYREGDEWYVSDLSGNGGNGVRLNGKRCFEARLEDGDIIELGPGRLRFRAGLS